jgi:cytochrome P450
MQWLLYYYCKHPEYQLIIQQEVDQALSSKDNDLALSLLDVKDFPFCHAFIKETLRLKPSATVLIFDAGKDTEIMGHFIPKGTQVLAMNRLAGVLATPGDNPFKFDPFRHCEKSNHPDVLRQLNNVGIAAFGTGPRMCPGRHVATLELLYLLVGIYACFDGALFELPDTLYPIEEEFNGSTKPVHFYPKMTLRQKYNGDYF